ncbi:hypothetical protein GCM10007940_15240 [Portibacter lacus]|uniref:Peptidase S74 domain-containing protein n=2 Tax=Portibacter lacus TaxID=1099794 RepID=A0AA37SNR2_9BACT|nr:hypothetical protein GCM10007940_15240 [Portibacter lacus]
MDIRSTNDNASGGELQLATPSESNFLRFFGGRLDDRNPFIGFNDLDTFHLITTLSDFSTYKRRMTLFPNGKMGLGTDQPQSELDIRTNAVDDGGEIHLSNADASYFLRLFSGKPSNPRPSIFWNFESDFELARFDGNVNYQPFLRLDGKRIHVLNNNGSVFLGENTGLSDNGSFNTAIGSFSLQNNVSGIRNTVLGYRAGSGSNVGSNFSGNVLIGYEAGLNITGSNRLYIENSSSATPLIYGEFDNNLVRINGRQEITGSLELNRGILSGVAINVNGQEALWSNGNYFSYGFGTPYNYFAKPIKIGPIEGSTVPYADLQIVDNAGNASISVESISNDAILQLSGATNSQNDGWTIRRRSDGDLEWRHNNISKMKLTSFGRLGIGTTSPSHILEVAGNTRFYQSINSASPNDLFVGTIENTSNNNNFRNNGLQIIAGHNTIGGGTTRSMYISFAKPNGTIIGAISQLDNNSIVYYESSDERLKEEIQPTRVGIETLMNINVRDYKWKNGNEDAIPTTGFIAQELYEIYPIAAKKGGEDETVDPWQIAPKQLIPLMVKSIQDQQHTIETLREENNVLSARLDRLEKLLDEKN